MGECDTPRWGPILPVEISQRGPRGSSKIELKLALWFDYFAWCGGPWNAESPGGGSALGGCQKTMRQSP